MLSGVPVGLGPVRLPPRGLGALEDLTSMQGKVSFQLLGLSPSYKTLQVARFYYQTLYFPFSSPFM